jgi:hypothetical protein
MGFPLARLTILKVKVDGQTRKISGRVGGFNGFSACPSYGFGGEG